MQLSRRRCASHSRGLGQPSGLQTLNKGGERSILKQFIMRTFSIYNFILCIYLSKCGKFSICRTIFLEAEVGRRVTMKSRPAWTTYQFQASIGRRMRPCLKNKAKIVYIYMASVQIKGYIHTHTNIYIHVKVPTRVTILFWVINKCSFPPLE